METPSASASPATTVYSNSSSASSPPEFATCRAVPPTSSSRWGEMRLRFTCTFRSNVTVTTILSPTP